jgi:hypothetical protein
MALYIQAKLQRFLVLFCFYLVDLHLCIVSSSTIVFVFCFCYYLFDIVSCSRIYLSLIVDLHCEMFFC